MVFLVVRHFVVPKSFGEYGHYRGAAIAEIAARPVHFAGQQTCETCHTDSLTPEAPASTPTSTAKPATARWPSTPTIPQSQPAKLDTAVLCIRCHAASAAKPKTFPQVDADEHAGGVACETCHQPHNPAIQAGGAK